MKFLISLFVILFCLSGSLLAQVSITESQAHFFKQMEDYCGRSFEGLMVFPDIDEVDPDLPSQESYRGKDLQWRLNVCTSDSIVIDYVVGDDWTRRWVLERKEEGLYLSIYRLSGKDLDQIELLQTGFAKQEEERKRRYEFEMKDTEGLSVGTTWRITMGSEGKVMSLIKKELVEEGRQRKTFHANFKLVPNMDEEEK